MPNDIQKAKNNCRLSSHCSNITHNSSINRVRYGLTCFQQKISESFPANFCMLLIHESMKLRLGHLYAMCGSSNLSMIVSQFYSKIIPLVGTTIHDRTSEGLQSLFSLQIYTTPQYLFPMYDLRKLHCLTSSDRTQL